MKFTLNWMGTSYPNYYYDTDENRIYRRSDNQYSAKPYKDSATGFNGKVLLNPDPPAHIIRDKYGKLMCNVDGVYRRMDWLVAYTVYGAPSNIIRLIHLDNDPDNYEWSNLKWFTQGDVVNGYLGKYQVERVEDIPEEWKVYIAPNNPNIQFEVSNLGNIRKNGELVNAGLDNDGYLRVTYVGNVKKDTYVLFLHRMVAELFVENPDPEHFDIVNHLDGDKMNCAFWNLCWCTLSENRDHATLNGLYQGRTSSEDMIEQLCYCISIGMPVKSICAKFNVTPKFVSAIVTGRRWTRISQKYTFPQTGWSDELKQNVRKLILQGKNASEIAVDLGIGKSNKFVSLYERLRRQLIEEGKLEKCTTFMKKN